MSVAETEGWIIHDERRMHLPELAPHCVQCLQAALAEAVHFLGCTMRQGLDKPNRRVGYNRDRAWEFLREHESSD